MDLLVKGPMMLARRLVLIYEMLLARCFFFRIVYSKQTCIVGTYEAWLPRKCHASHITEGIRWRCFII